MARLIVDAGRPPRSACFHAHLGAEKALKAVILAGGGQFRFVHNLLELRGQLPEEVQTRFDPSGLAMLNRWAVAGRYTVERSDATSEQATHLISVAGDMVEAARAAMADIGSRR